MWSRLATFIQSRRKIASLDTDGSAYSWRSPLDGQPISPTTTGLSGKRWRICW